MKKFVIAAALLIPLTLFGDSAVVDGPSHEGIEVTVDLPKSEHIRNFGAPADGLGLCVFCSMTQASRWQNITKLVDLLYWDKDGKPHSKIQEGGGYPAKVDKVIKEFAPDAKYVQYEGADPAILDTAIKDGRMPCVTYGIGERYGNQKIAHMVNLVHLDEKWGAILDNNFPGTIEWMSREEFIRRWKYPSGQGWALVFLEPPPPPIPHN